jgi:flagellar biosynthetic protein FlhB
MAEESFQEKTEPATPKRREEAARKGQVARSQELNSAVVLIVSITSIYFLGGKLFQDLASFTINTIEQSHTYEMNANSFRVHMLGWGRIFFMTIGPILLILGVTSLAISLGQVGFTINEEALSPKFNRLDPVQGAKKMFSKRSLVELTKGIFKILIIGYISYITIVPALPQILVLADAGLGNSFGFIGRMVFEVGINTSLVLLILAILDYMYQKWEHNQSIRMTKQEVKEEQKQTEGDPQIRMRIRTLQREAARQRMMDEVPEADVVITNPTHYAVAIKYDMEFMDAPKVVAKGQNLIAQKIKQVAKDAGIPVVENKPLAQALFRAVEIGQNVPEELYRAVAEVLAYVFRLKAK